jgi:uncharacterized membrane protein
MKFSEQGRWKAFGVAVWIIGITVLIAGFAFSQQRETQHVRQCALYNGMNCVRYTEFDQVVLTPLAIVGYFLAVFGVLLIISGFIVFFVLDHVSKSRRTKTSIVQDGAPPENG